MPSTGPATTQLTASVSPYLRLVAAGFRRWSTYRQAALAGVVTNCVFGFLRCAVLLTVFATGARVGGYDPAQIVTFVWVGQAMLAVVLVWGGFDLADRVRTGDIAIDLARPWDLQVAQLADDLGRAGFAVFARGVVPVLVGIAFFPFRLPEHVLTWLVFAVSLVLAVVASFAIRFMLNLAAFWLLDIRGLVGLYAGIGGLFMGFTVPVSFYPDWLETAVWCTPFPAVLQVPLDVFVERYDAGTTALLLGHQVAWAAILLVAGRMVLRRAERRVVVQGG